MECAGNGRAHRAAVREPAVAARGGRDGGVAGTPLAPLLDEAGARRRRGRGRSSPASTAACEGGVEQAYERSLPVAEARARRGAARLRRSTGRRCRRSTASRSALVRPGWYGMTNVKWLRAITRRRRAVRRLPAGVAYRLRQYEDERGRAGDADPPARADGAARHPDFLTRRRCRRRGPVPARGPRLVGPARRSPRRRERRTAVRRGRTPCSRRPRPPWAWRALALRVGRDARASTCSAAARATTPGTYQPLEPPWNVGGYANNAVQRIPVAVTEVVAERRRRTPAIYGGFAWWSGLPTLHPTSGLQLRRRFHGTANACPSSLPIMGWRTIDTHDLPIVWSMRIRAAAVGLALAAVAGALAVASTDAGAAIRSPDARRKVLQARARTQRLRRDPEG